MKITKSEFEIINKKFDEYNEKNAESFKYIKGKEKIILSAPHSVSQIRNGRIKGKDIATGAIAISLQKSLNCYCIYKTRNDNDDANYDIEKNPYKDKLLEIIEKENIKFLLDIHGAKASQGFDIDIATNDLKNINGKTEYVTDFINLGKKYGINNITVDKVFKASTLHTIAYTISEKLKIPCLEIELSKEYRDVKIFKNIQILLNFLEEYLSAICRKEEK